MLKVDNIDLMVQGFRALDGCFLSLVNYPKLKEPDANNWHEDGYDPDLNGYNIGENLFIMPVDSKSVSLTLYAPSITAYNSLLTTLTSATSNIWDLGVGRTFTMRYTSCDTSFFNGTAGGKVALNFLIDDFRYSLKSKSHNNDFSFDDFGIEQLWGAYNNSINGHEIRPGGTTNSKYSDGVHYLGSNGYLKSKSITIPCLMTAPTVAAFWQKYDKLFNTLTLAGVRTIKFLSIGEEQCHYDSCASNRIWQTGSAISWAFELTFKVIG